MCTIEHKETNTMKNKKVLAAINKMLRPAGVLIVLVEERKFIPSYDELTAVTR
jgi:hypothetical protein